MSYIEEIGKFINFHTLYSKGISKENTAEFKAAQDYLYLALSINRDSIDCHKAIIRVCKKYREIYNAIDLAKKACKKFDNEPEFYSMLGDIHRKRKEYEEAINCYTEAIKIDSTNLENFKIRSQIKFQSGDIQGAINDLTSILEYNKKDINALAQRAFYKFQIKNYESAIEDYTQAIKISPKTSHYYFMRGSIRNLTGDKKEAEKDFQAAKKFLDK